jgi:cytochrome P450
MTPEEAGRVFVDPSAYADETRFHEACTVLRSESPVHDDPFRFDVGRGPNDHLAFGLGAHFCLGAHLARLEIRLFLEELLPRIDTIDLTGDPVSSPTTFVGGLTSLPIKYRLRDR